MRELLTRLERNIISYRLLAPGQKALVAVSGGMDSMVLLRLLHMLSGKYDWQLTVAHFNHQLRGRASDADEKRVQREAGKLNLRVYTARADVRKAAKRDKLSLEMTARRLRHEFLARIALRLKIQTIVLAHHADDQLEHFFLRLFRGSGGEGLAGMKWRNRSPANARIELIRPLLDVPKSMVADYAKENKVAYGEDASNAWTEIPRNRVRHKLLPLLMAEYAPALDRTVLRAMDLIGAETELIGQMAEEWLRVTKKQKRQPRSPTNFTGAAFEELPVAIQRRCLQLQLRQKSLAADFETIEHLRARVDVPITVGSAPKCVMRDSEGRINVRTPRRQDFDMGHAEIELGSVPGDILFDDVHFRWQTCLKKGISFPVAPGRETFDFDSVGSKITLRHWRPGDRFQPLGMSQPVKLQDLFTNAKVPREVRHTRIAATTASGELFWVEGMRISERFKLTKKTIRRLQWQWERL